MDKDLYVYILRCRGGTYYTGITNDVERRVWEHNNDPNPSSYTFSRRPAQLVFVENFGSWQEAIDYEKQVKDWSRKKKEALIARRYDLLPGFSKKPKK